MNDTIETIVNEVEGFIEKARQMADEGKEPDLDGLDVQVRELVGKIQQIPVEQFGQIQPHLEGLTTQLDELKASLQQQKNSVEAQINELPNQQKAHNAYEKARVTGLRAQEEAKDKE